jgi:hypothetical protein
MQRLKSIRLLKVLAMSRIFKCDSCRHFVDDHHGVFEDGKLKSISYCRVAGCLCEIYAKVA